MELLRSREGREGGTRGGREGEEAGCGHSHHPGILIANPSMFYRYLESIFLRGLQGLQ